MFYSWKDTVDTLLSVFVCVFAVPSLSVCMLSLHTVSPKYVSSMFQLVAALSSHHIFDHKHIVCHSALTSLTFSSHWIVSCLTWVCVWVCVFVTLQHQSLRLSDVHRKAQLWRGIVSISLIEAHDLQPMDANGLSDPYVKFRMGHQKYKSKVWSAWSLFKLLVHLGLFLSCKVNSGQVCFFSSMQTIPKTLNPQWREQFDFHLYDEQGSFIDITIWDKDAGKKDDFMGRLVMNLTFLCCSHTLIVWFD